MYVSPEQDLLILPEVMGRVRLSDTTIYRLEKACRFPPRIRIGFKRVAWKKRDIDAFVNGTWSAEAAEASS